MYVCFISMVSDYTNIDRGDDKSHGPMEDQTAPDGVDRRGFLKQASSAGAGFALLENRLDKASPNGKIQFSNVGLRYRIEDDTEPEYVHDCAPSRWDMLDGELVFYTHYLSSAEASRLAAGQAIVSAKTVHDLPVNQVTVAKEAHLPTTLGDGLKAQQGVLFDSSYSLPTPRIVTAGMDISVEAGQASQRITQGEEAVVELDTTTVGLRKFEAQPTADGTTGEENDQGVTYEQKVVETTVTPELIVRNHGETAFYTVNDRLEVN